MEFCDVRATTASHWSTLVLAVLGTARSLPPVVKLRNNLAEEVLSMMLDNQPNQDDSIM
jgi:hypothetical protein